MGYGSTLIRVALLALCAFVYCPFARSKFLTGKKILINLCTLFLPFSFFLSLTFSTYPL
jgi:hypothetical protein